MTRIDLRPRSRETGPSAQLPDSPGLGRPRGSPSGENLIGADAVRRRNSASSSVYTQLPGFASIVREERHFSFAAAAARYANPGITGVSRLILD